MKELIHISGEKLTLKFSPEGALSSARLGSRDVTSELRFLRVGEYQLSLRVFGFRENWGSLLEVFSQLDRQLKGFNLSVLNIEETDTELHNVFLCSSKDPSFVHKATRLVMQFDVNERKFKDLVRSFDIDDTLCRRLKGEIDVHDS